MKVVNKKMYHYHRRDIHPELWIPKKKIIVDDNFNSLFGKMYEPLLSHAVELYLMYLEDPINNKSSLDAFNNILNEGIQKYTEIFKRETILEVSRRLKDSSLPSREHCIWLCDEEGIVHWKDALDCSHHPESSFNGHLASDTVTILEIFQVSVTGDLFRTSDFFIPDSYLPTEELFEESKKYWDPNFTEKYQERQTEYLFQGELKILKKLR